jgi:hypothetical protein
VCARICVFVSEYTVLAQSKNNALIITCLPGSLVVRVLTISGVIRVVRAISRVAC